EVDTAIVGGGLVGAALAYGLRALRDDLVVLDEGDRAQRAARGNFGLIWVQGKGLGLPGYGAWTQRSAREWPRLAADLREETGIDVALRQPGGVHLCFTARELEARRAHVDALMAQPGFARYDVEFLDRAALAARLPGLSGAVVGGTYCAQDGDCNPLLLLRALHAASQAAGCRYRPGAAVDAIEPVGERFLLRTREGVVAARRVVLAAGLANARLAPQVGIMAPVRANKGQIIALERAQPFLPLPVETLRQTDDGTVLIGDSQQDADDDALDPAVLAAMAKRALAAFPALAGLRVVRAWAALRVMSPDGFPIYAQSALHRGAFVAACHSGVTLAAVHAHVLAPALAAGALPPACAEFTPGRFDVRAAA
ncbi:MAG: FAD-dependent oxidoreductase, partial [Betaproteobacteria bacterium]